MTRKQGRQRSDAKRYEYDGKNLTLKEWAEELGITTSAIRKRIQAGRPPDQIFAPDLRITSGERKYFRKYLRKLEREADERKEAYERSTERNNNY